jgi:ABC-type dipeptide/oligopeptide/nickel transport system ATPase component
MTDSTLSRLTRQQWLNALRWQQGEHVVLIGQTGSGKTQLARQLLLKRRYVVVMGLKKYDESLQRYQKEGYHLITGWPPEYGDERVLFWPKANSLRDVEPQRKAVARVIESVYQSGGWCIYFDEMGYASHLLGLKRDIVVLLNQGRSSGISVVGSMTRPSSATAGTPLEAFSQVRHVYLFPTQDENEHIRMAQIARMPLLSLRAALARLAPYEFIAVDHNTVTHVGR